MQRETSFSLIKPGIEFDCSLRLQFAFVVSLFQFNCKDSGNWNASWTWSVLGQPEGKWRSRFTDTQTASESIRFLVTSLVSHQMTCIEIRKKDDKEKEKEKEKFGLGLKVKVRRWMKLVTWQYSPFLSLHPRFFAQILIRHSLFVIARSGSILADLAAEAQGEARGHEETNASASVNVFKRVTSITLVSRREDKKTGEIGMSGESSESYSLKFFLLVSQWPGPVWWYSGQVSCTPNQVRSEREGKTNREPRNWESRHMRSQKAKSKSLSHFLSHFLSQFLSPQEMIQERSERCISPSETTGVSCVRKSACFLQSPPPEWAGCLAGKLEDRLLPSLLKLRCPVAGEDTHASTSPSTSPSTSTSDLLLVSKHIDSQKYLALHLSHSTASIHQSPRRSNLQPAACLDLTSNKSK